MARRRRYFESGRMYEITIRARTGLPFPHWCLIQLLLASALARTQRSSYVTLCHFLWMANHLHLLFIAKDAESCAQYYAELMKKITDYYKALLGYDYLELWEKGGPVVSRILDLDRAIDRIAYLYSNPGRANLVASVDDYPGFSSWGEFRADPTKNSHTEIVPWVRQPSIRKAPSRHLDERQDKFLTEELKTAAKLTHDLTFSPNSLYQAFGVSDAEQVSSYNERVLLEIRNREEEYARERELGGKTCFGKYALQKEPLMKPHLPKRSAFDRKILFHTSHKELAFSFLRQFQLFCRRCREAYVAWREGNYLEKWPPGAFRPPLRPVANAIG